MKKLIAFSFSFLFLFSCISFNSVLKDLDEQSYAGNIINSDKENVYNALLASIQSYNSYENTPLEPLTDYFDPLVFEGIIFDKTGISKKEKLGLIYKSKTKNQVIVAFRGSKSAQDWINDMRFVLSDEYRRNYLTDQSPDSKILVETGFFVAYNAVRDAVFDLLKDVIHADNNTMIYVTGHSLGGTSAGLFALDYVYNVRNKNGSNLKLVTFASPRIGNGNFVNIYSSVIMNSIRIINQADTIPEFPLENTLGNEYRHFNYQYSMFFYLKKYGMEINLPSSQKNVKYIYNTPKFAECRTSCHVVANYQKAVRRIFYNDLSEPDLLVLNPFLKYKN